MKFKFIFLLLLTPLIAPQAFAQQLNAEGISFLNQQQDSLAAIGEQIYDAEDDLKKLAYNATFVKKLIAALKTPHSFQHNLEKVDHISIQKATDLSFRIITWSVAFTDGTYKFYGTIQMATNDGSLKMIPLNDDTKNFKDDNLISTPKNWYGARYYDMIPVTSTGNTPYYVLLGWKGNNTKTTKKVIEILSFEQNQPIFGKNVFEMPKGAAVQNRVVFEYNKLNSMTLAYDKNVNMIIFDHLAPYDENMVGNFEFYGSDLSFDAYVLNYPKLKLQQDVLLKNETSEMDEFYAAPRKATTLIPKDKR